MSKDRIEHYGICGRIDVADIYDNQDYRDNNLKEDTTKRSMPMYQEKR